MTKLKRIFAVKNESVNDNVKYKKKFLNTPLLVFIVSAVIGSLGSIINIHLDKNQFYKQQQDLIAGNLIDDIQALFSDEMPASKDGDFFNLHRIQQIISSKKNIIFTGAFSKARIFISVSDSAYAGAHLNKIAKTKWNEDFKAGYSIVKAADGAAVLEAVFPVNASETLHQVYGVCILYDFDKILNKYGYDFYFSLIFSLIIVFITALVLAWLVNIFISKPITNFVYGSVKEKQKIYFEIRQLVNYLKEIGKEDRKILSKKIDSESRLRRLIGKLEQEIAKRNVRLTSTQSQLKKEAQVRTNLEIQSRKMSRIIEQSPTSIVITDLLGNIEYVNPRFTEVTGYSFDECMGENPRILKSGEMSPEGYEELWRTITDGDIWRGEFHNKKKNGELYWEFAHIAPVKNEDGEVTHYIAIKEDVTKQKETEEKNLMFAMALQSTDDMVTITDLENNFIYVNEAFLKTYEYSIKEIIGQNAEVLSAEEDPAEIEESIIQNTLNSGWSGDLKNKTKTGRVFPISLTTSVINNDRGRPFALVGISRDLSLVKEALELERKTEMLRTLQELAAAVSHEFSQPLQSLSNFAGLMRMGRNKVEYIEQIEQSISRIADLVKNLREITNIQRQSYVDVQIMDIKASAEKVIHDGEPTVLVVDDEEMILETMKEMITFAGYRCDSAKDGMEALKLAGQNKYQLILSDVNMPKMSGTILFSKLQSIGFNGAFFFMTGYDMSKELTEIIDQSDGILHKPVNSQTLLKIIKSVFVANENDKTS